MLRRLLLVGGIAAFGLGALALYAPGLVLFQQTTVVLAIGVVAVVQSIRVLRDRIRGGVTTAATVDPERPRSAETPGDGFDRRLAAVGGNVNAEEARSRLRSRLRELVADVVADHEGISDEEAREQVATGTWTDDVRAAAFVGTRVMTANPASVRERMSRALSGPTGFVADYSHTVTRLATRAGLLSSSSGAAPPERDVEVRSDETARQTNRWRGVSAVGLAAVGLGTVVVRPALVLAGAVGVVFATYARGSDLGTVDVSVDREIDADDPGPGDEVPVRVTVRNEGEETLPDLRVVDGVPEALAVVNGSARCAVSLRPGKRATFTYSVEADRGVHEWGQTRLLARDYAGADEVDTAVETESRLVCRPRYAPLEQFPLPMHATGLAGRLPLEQSGSGVEFYGIREYRPGDPMKRVDWHRLARTGELSTVEFRIESEATVVVLVDARSVAYRAPIAAGENAVERSLEAAGRLFATFDELGYRVGLGALSPERFWLEPDRGTAHRQRAMDAIAEHPAFPTTKPSGDFDPKYSQRRVRQQLDADAQVVFLTPLCDGLAKLVALRLDAYGYPVTVVSPDPTAQRSTGHRMARLERATRIADLRRRGVRVIDWDWEEPLHSALLRGSEWSP